MRRARVPEPAIAVRALRTEQGTGLKVYGFFIGGAHLLQIAEINRAHRDGAGALQGFQRKEIRRHVQSIVEFLDGGPVLFPNAIILALSPRARFVESRGGKPGGDTGVSVTGTLRIPLPPDGTKTAWIVDGQQRFLALSKTRNKDFPVSVVAFVSEDLTVHREQFILVNKARPLPPRLIDELLPEVPTSLPKDLAARKVPSELVNLLNLMADSPFRGLIRRASEDRREAVVTDAALVRVIQRSLGSALGVLAPYKETPTSPADPAAMYRVLAAFWDAAREIFPGAWGLPPTESRLMHAAGIEAMGILMDRVMSRVSPDGNLRKHAAESLACIAPYCCWTSGRWPDIERDWNDIQAVPRDIRLLSDQLMRLDHRHSFARAA